MCKTNEHFANYDFRDQGYINFCLFSFFIASFFSIISLLASQQRSVVVILFLEGNLPLLGSPDAPPFPTNLNGDLLTHLQTPFYSFSLSNTCFIGVSIDEVISYRDVRSRTKADKKLCRIIFRAAARVLLRSGHSIPRS